MKVKREVVKKRRDDLMKHIQERGNATVIELSELFSVSELTIRRDLEYWESRNAVERYYGGAKLIQDFVSNPSESLKEQNKRAIAKYAAQHVVDGDIIFINSSSTALMMIPYIKDKYVTVITNNGKAVNIECDPRVTILLTGGEIKFPKESLVGDFAISSLEKVRANKLFLGCSGFDIEQGATTAIIDEVQINRVMMERCNGEKFLLADSSKFEKVYNFQISNLNEFNYLITDRDFDSEYVDPLKKIGLEIISLDPIN